MNTTTKRLSTWKFALFGLVWLLGSVWFWAPACTRPLALDGFPCADAPPACPSHLQCILGFCRNSNDIRDSSPPQDAKGEIQNEPDTEPTHSELSDDTVHSDEATEPSQEQPDADASIDQTPEEPTELAEPTEQTEPTGDAPPPEWLKENQPENLPNCKDHPKYDAECSVGWGECLQKGKLKCSPDQRSLQCSATPKAPAPIELCNGLDDNCNGLIDEDFPSLGKPCFKHINNHCRTFGVYVCSKDLSAVECNAPTPKQQAKEDCNNGLDDNCDGQINEGCSCGGIIGENIGKSRQCSFCNAADPQCLQDACAGTQKCVRSGTLGSKWEACTAPPPTGEVCNGKDDDCNGKIDEIYTATILPCEATTQVGACRKGRKKCIENADKTWSEVCVPMFVKDQQPELCNGIDDNCNGLVDEGCGCQGCAP